MPWAPAARRPWRPGAGRRWRQCAGRRRSRLAEPFLGLTPERDARHVVKEPGVPDSLDTELGRSDGPVLPGRRRVDAEQGGDGAPRREEDVVAKAQREDRRFKRLPAMVEGCA